MNQRDTQKKLNTSRLRVVARLIFAISSRFFRTKTWKTFDRNYYVFNNRDIVKSYLSPWVHYVAFGESEGRCPNAVFNPRFFAAEADIQVKVRPLLSLSLSPNFSAIKTTGSFSPASYLSANKDVLESKMSAQTHWVKHGQFEGRRLGIQIDWSFDKNRLPSEKPFVPGETSLGWQSLQKIHSVLSKDQGDQVKVSIIVPCYKSDPYLLEACIESVVKQSYTNWELILVADDESAKNTINQLKIPSIYRSKIKVKETQGHTGISEATNCGSYAATGDWVLLLDHDDMLDANALIALVASSKSYPEISWFYSDTLKIDSIGRTLEPMSKVPFDPILLLNYMYCGQVIFLKMDAWNSLGGFDSDFDGVQDHDLAIRAVELGLKFMQVPEYLYLWRATETSTALDTGTKPLAQNRGIKLIEGFLERKGIHGRVKPVSWAKTTGACFFEIEFLDQSEAIDVVIPSFNNLNGLRRLLNSLKWDTSYQNMRVRVLLDEYSPAEMSDLLSEYPEISWSKGNYVANGRFSYSLKMNFAMSEAKSDYVCLLNDDVLPINSGWLTQLMGYARLADAGVVGSLLTFPNGKIQHAGIATNLDGNRVHHIAKGEENTPGYYGILSGTRITDGVTAAACLVNRKDFLDVGGFNETHLQLAYNDIELCERLSASGRMSIWTPTAHLIHEEGGTRGTTNYSAEMHFYQNIERPLINRWGPNWDQSSITPRVLKPIKSKIRNEVISPRILWFIHDAGIGGATKVALDIAGYVAEQGLEVSVLSPISDSAEQNNGLLNYVDHLALSPTDTTYDITAKIESAKCLINKSNANLVVANTLLSLPSVVAAIQLGIPTMWHIHESEGPAFFKDYDSVIDKHYLPLAMAEADRVVFVSKESQAQYKNLVAMNDLVITLGRPELAESKQDKRMPNLALESLNGIAETSTKYLCVGTVCRRKGQDRILRLLKTFEDLGILEDLYFNFVGRIDPDFNEEITKLLESLTYYRSRVQFHPEVPDVSVFYEQSDVFLFPSRMEAYPLVVGEALYYNLPILSTNCEGVSHMLEHGLFGLAVDYSEEDSGLSSWGTEILKMKDKVFRDGLKVRSSQGYECLVPKNEYLDNYCKVICSLL